MPGADSPDVAAGQASFPGKTWQWDADLHAERKATGSGWSGAPHISLHYCRRICQFSSTRLLSSSHNPITFPAPFQTWVLDSWPFRARESFGELRDTERVLDAIAALPQPLPSREALYQRLGEQGFSEGLQQWLGSNLRQRGKGQYVWQFDLEGARSMLEDYCTQGELGVPVQRGPLLVPLMHQQG